MNPLRLLPALAVACCVYALAARATTVIPPTLDELVERSESVVRAKTVSTRCDWRGEGEERRIVTVVTVEVTDAIVGSPAHTLELEFLGGEIDGERMFVVGQSRLEPGNEDILFLSRQHNALSPLVRMMYGHYLVARRDDGRALVARANGMPLLALDQISAPLDAPPSPEVRAAVMAADVLSPDTFCDAIRASARRQGRADVNESRAGGRQQ